MFNLTLAPVALDRASKQLNKGPDQVDWEDEDYAENRHDGLTLKRLHHALTQHDADSGDDKDDKDGFQLRLLGE